MAAIVAYSSALEVLTRETSPPDWADLHNNLGTALSWLGERDKTTEPLLAAVAAHHEALQVFNRVTSPMRWAGTQLNLGLAVRRLGGIAREVAHFDTAEAAYADCLPVWTRLVSPFDWTKTQWNLADLALARHALTPDPALPIRAQNHLSQARQIFAEDANAHQLAECDRLQAQIDHLQPQPLNIR